MKSSIKMAISFGALVLAITAGAQEIMKHPRVVELEDSLKDSASAYVRSRFPGVPFMVTVKVDPLRRDTAGRGFASEKTSLPFYDSDTDEELRDEWDNPQVPLKALINRVKRIQVSILIPTKVHETEVTELKEGLFSSLHLTQARDEITIDRKEWVTQEIPWVAIYVVAGVLMTLLLGLLIINRTSANRIARALTDMKAQNTAGNSTPASTPMSLPDAETKSAKGQSQELKFNDPIRMKELAARNIELLIQDSAFPSHQDIFLLDKFGHEHPEKLGAILAEFPGEMQKKLFSYSADFHWVEALNDPGFLDFASLEVFQALAQHTRSTKDVGWYHTVLAVWRLNSHRTQFLKGLPKDEAFALLTEMPKAIAVSDARKAFPGSWASILDPNFQPKPLSAARSKEIQQSAVQILPLYNIELVAKYRSERELLDYLKLADPIEERDIYGAAPESSLIHSLRPPFFPVFEQHAETLQWFVPLVGVDQWTLALFNLPKSERAKIDSHLSEKQRFMMVERFKKFDSNPPEKASVGTTREKIAVALKKYLAEKATADKVNTDIDSITGSDHGDKAA